MAKINQKYFGNRNIGTGGQQLTVDDNGNVITPADDKIGGEGIAAINFPNDAGSFAGNSNVPVLTVVPAIPAPTLPGGVQATYTILYEAYSVSTGAGKTGLNVGDTFGHVSLPGLVAKVTDLSGSNAVFSCTVAGASVSNALTLAQIPQDTIGITLTKIAGTGSASSFNTDVLFHVKSVTITEKGSGYVGTETLPAFTKPGTTNGNVPVGVLAFTTDSGAVGSSTNQENAIFCYAKISDAITNAQPADIIKQRGTKRFKVKTASGSAICELKAGALSASAATDTGKMTIMALDDTNGTYYVTKIGGRRCTIVRGNGTAFATDSSVPWVFSKSDPAYDAATTVVIANA